MQSPFRDIRFAYQLHYHFGFRTRYRKPLFTDGQVAETLRCLLAEVCESRGYHLLECHVDPIFLRALLSLRSEHAPSQVAQALKGVLSRRAKQAHPAAFGTLSGGQVWADGYFCRSVGKARRDVIEGYVERQWEHHGYTADDLRRMRYRFGDGEAPVLVDLCYHIVLATERRVLLFWPEVADVLVAHLPDALAGEGCRLRAATFVPDHVHFSIRALATAAPERVALVTFPIDAAGQAWDNAK